MHLPTTLFIFMVLKQFNSANSLHETLLYNSLDNMRIRNKYSIHDVQGVGPWLRLCSQYVGRINARRTSSSHAHYYGKPLVHCT